MVDSLQPHYHETPRREKVPKASSSLAIRTYATAPLATPTEGITRVRPKGTYTPGRLVAEPRAARRTNTAPERRDAHANPRERTSPRFPPLRYVGTARPATPRGRPWGRGLRPRIRSDPPAAAGAGRQGQARREHPPAVLQPYRDLLVGNAVALRAEQEKKADSQ